MKIGDIYKTANNIWIIQDIVGEGSSVICESIAPYCQPRWASFGDTFLTRWARKLSEEQLLEIMFAYNEYHDKLTELEPCKAYYNDLIGAWNEDEKEPKLH